MELGETSALLVSGEHKPDLQQRLENHHLKIPLQTTISQITKGIKVRGRPALCFSISKYLLCGHDEKSNLGPHD